MAASSSFSPRVLFVVVFLVVAVANLAGGARSGAGDTVSDSCDAIRDFVDVAFCETALRSSSGAAATDRHGHLLIAADLAAKRGDSARSTAAAAAAAGGEMRDGMEACEMLYGSSSVPAVRMMRRYAAARRWEAARSLMWLSSQAGIGCAAALGGDGGAAAAATGMDKENEDFRKLAAMATALLNSVAVGSSG
uniref:Pectinesterase inhibitor domain-containing protein n=1 Tax=Leersia perrieri TaxID=77586 RepID=A0A0D9Y155_9ORYZ